MDFDPVATGIYQWNHMSLLPEAREMTPSSRWELASQVPEECWFYLTIRNPLIAQFEIISRHTNSTTPQKNPNINQLTLAVITEC